jgi:hypothetical protein
MSAAASMSSRLDGTNEVKICIMVMLANSSLLTFSSAMHAHGREPIVPNEVSLYVAVGNVTLRI